MVILWKSWLTVTTVILVILAGFAGLSLFQNAALLSELKQRRIAVVAETAGQAFKPVVDLGLPLSMMRNGDATLARLQQTDPEISKIRVFNPAGIVVYTTGRDRPSTIGEDATRAWQLADGDAWSFETAETLFNGWTIRRKDGTVVGGVLVSYPGEQLSTLMAEAERRTLSFAALLWAAFSLMALAVLMVLLREPIRTVRRLQRIANGEALSAPTAISDPPARSSGDPLADLVTNLAEADRQEARVSRLLGDLNAHVPQKAPAAPISGPGALVRHDPARSRARTLARLLLPWAVGLILLPAVLLGWRVLYDARDYVAPEIDARVTLIGSIVSENVQRAVSAGIPIEALSESTGYFGGLLSRFPEIGYLAIAQENVILETGSLADESQPVSQYPILLEGNKVGEVLVGIAPGFVTRSYLDLFLDVGVIALVSVLVAFEVLVLMISRSVTGPIDRLSHLAALQAAGDFSKRALSGARGSIDSLVAGLSERAANLNRAFAALVPKGTHPNDPRLQALAKRYKLGSDGPARLVFAYLTDVRLALFLFSVADELPLSFMPLYTRAAENPLPWLNEGVLLSLPLAGYLFAILLASPFARQFTQRFGHRSVLVIGVIPALLGQIGLATADSAMEIVAYRTVTGFGYAIVTLVCQDYVIDVSPAKAQHHALAQFSLVLFGGVFAGTALGGVLADRLGFSAVFMISAGLILIAGVLFLRLLPVWKDGTQVLQSGRLFPPIAGPMRNLRFAGLVLGIAIPWNIQNQAFICYLVSLSLDSLGASPADIGRVLMLNYLLLAFAGPLVTRFFGNRIAPSGLVLCGAVLAGAALLPASAGLTIWTMLAAVIAGGLGQGIARGPQVSVALKIAEREHIVGGSDAALAALRTLERGGSIVGLIAIAAVVGIGGYEIAVFAVAAWVLCGALLFLFSEYVLPALRQPNPNDVID